MTDEEWEIPMMYLKLEYLLNEGEKHFFVFQKKNITVCSKPTWLQNSVKQSLI